MKKLVLIDGNSILNRAFYGTMSSKMLVSADGTYTNAIYGFLAIMFKILDDIKPEYLAIAFDLKAPTKRHQMYKEYKGTRKAMPNELASQMQPLKDILKNMNITIIEKEGYEADDIIGTLAKKGEKENLDVTILSGDRDTFQLVSKNIKVRIPHTKLKKTETEDFDEQKIKETYDITPIQLIETKGLMGDSSDNIPGVPGVGEKTAFELIKKFGTIDNIYKEIENGNSDIKESLKTKMLNNKELCLLSKTLGTIDINADIDTDITNLQLKDWNNEKVLEDFKKYNFNRFIERFNLEDSNQNKEAFDIETINLESEKDIQNILKEVIKEKLIYYYMDFKSSTDEDLIIQKEITGISLYFNNKVYYIKYNQDIFKKIFENDELLKVGYRQKEQYIILTQYQISPRNLLFDIEVAAYLLNSTTNKYNLEDLCLEYLKFDISSINTSKQDVQMDLFSQNNIESNSTNNSIYAYCIYKLYYVLKEKLKSMNELDLFNNIEMPLVEVLAEMQISGIYVDKQELIKYGEKLQQRIEELTSQIYEITGYEFNINSTKQLGEILFDKLQLPVYKKTKSGYSTDVDVLEKLRKEHPVIDRILEYRQIMKLNSTYVEGLIPYINKKDNRIHSYFHQIVTATGRISSTDPNLQNIPIRMELGKKLRQVFKPIKDTIFLDADYSQVELRILASISNDENMINAFLNDEDIHKQVASKVFDIPLDEVTKEQRAQAKAVNFGIVYGISDFGLSEQLKIPKKQAKQYIEQYLEKYSGIKQFMTDIIEKAKQDGYVETLFNRRRYVPELNSNNYMVRQFGSRVALNTPIQGTAADIMKIAMVNVYKKLKENNLKSKIIVQVHDELLIETYLEEKQQVQEILVNEMENAINFKVPLKVEVSEGCNWYEAK